MKRAVFAILVAALLASDAGRLPTSAAPACDTAEEGDWIDHFKNPADDASEKGQHRLAMTLYAKAADYAASCAAEDTVNTKARSHTGDPGYNPSSTFYAPTVFLYESAAQEASRLGLDRNRCRYMRISESLRKYTDFADEKPDAKTAHLLRGCR